MSSVDNRIVQMRFDNKQFEDGVQTSIKSLDNLKKGLDMDESGKRLSNLEQAVDGISAKFSTLGIIGVTALANITNSVINTGKQMLSSLTIAPISEGLADYNRKLTSVQTITNATGKNIKEVTKYFDQLDVYADKTIYNLDDMTSAFAKFTNAGVNLDQSIPAIKGIANMVALAGQDAGAAQIAMYNLSQSIAGGFLTTTDYRSLNLANVATKEWKEQLIQGAIAAGTLKKNSKGMYLIKGAKQATTEAALFTEELSKGWASTKVLLDVLGKYGDETTKIGAKAQAAAQDVKSFGMMMDTLKAQVGTGWTDTFELLIGNLDEAKALFTPLTNTIGAFIDATAKARNNVLAFWKANGGRDAIIQAIVNSFEALKAILKPIGEAFREVFPPATGQALVTFSKGLRDVTAKLKIGANTASVIKLAFKGLFEIIDLGIKGFEFLAGAVKLLIKTLMPSGDSIEYVMGKIADFLLYLNNLVDTSNIVGDSLNYLGAGFAFVRDIITKVVQKVSPLLSAMKDALLGLFSGTKVYAAELKDTREVFTTASTETGKLKDAFSKLHGIMVTIGTSISNVAKKIKEMLLPVFAFLKEKLSEMSIQDFGALLTGAGFLTFARALSKGISSTDKIVKSFSKVLDQVAGSLKAFQKKVKAEALLKIAIAVGILALALIALSFIDMDKLAKSLGIMTVVFTELALSLILINKYVSNGIKGILTMFALSTQMVAIGVGILMLALALKMLASLDADKLKQGVIAIGALMTMLAAFIKITKGGDLKASAGGLAGFSIGILIMAGALAILGKMKYEQLMQGTLAIAGLITIIAAFVNLTKGGDLAKSAGGMFGFAVGIAVLAGALSLLGKMKYEQLMQGTLAIAGLITMIGAFVTLTSGGDLTKSAGGMFGFATAILILTGALVILGNIKYEQLMQGTIALGTLITMIGAFVTLTSGGDLAKSAGGLIGFAVGIIIITKALETLGKLKYDQLMQGTLALSALMTVIAAFIISTGGADLAVTATGLIGFSIGLMAMSAAVYVLAAIDSKKVTQGIMALAAVMTTIALFINLTKGGDLAASATGLIGFSTGLMILAGVIAVLSALNPQKLVMASTAIAMLMTSIAVFVKMAKGGNLAKSSAGLIAFSIGIGILAVALSYLGQLDYKQLLASGAAISILMLSIAAFVKLTSGGDLILSAAGLAVFAGAIMILTQVLVALGGLDVKTLAIGIGALAAIFVVLGLSALVLAPLTPVILALSAAILLFGLGCMAVGAWMLMFSKGLTELAKSGSEGATALANVITTIIGLIPLAMTTLAKGIIDFAKTIGDGAPVVATAFMKVFSAIIDTVTIMTPKMVDSGMKLVTGILRGIANNIAGVISAGVDVVLQFIGGVITKLPVIIDTAFKVITAFINGLADAIRGNHASIYAAIGNLISAVKDAFLDLLPDFSGVGKNVVDGFISGLRSKINAAANWAGSLATSVLESAKKVLGIHSPSKAFAEIGRYSAEGFGVGLRKFGWFAGARLLCAF
jgi:hypothetical protein